MAVDIDRKTSVFQPELYILYLVFYKEVEILLKTQIDSLDVTNWQYVLVCTYSILVQKY